MASPPPAPAAPTTAPAWRWWPALLWMGVIFAASADSGSGESSGAMTTWLLQHLGLQLNALQAEWVEHLLRKLGHFGEYALLAALLLWAVAPPGPTQPKAVVQAWFLSLAYAHSDELHQAFVPQRGPAMTDVWIDATGASFALLLLSLVAFWRRRREAPTQAPRG